jgi:chaperone BCS1
VGTRRRAFASIHPDRSQKKTLQYSPWNGTFPFWYKNHLLTYHSVQSDDSFFPDISISCIGRSSKILQDL